MRIIEKRKNIRVSAEFKINYFHEGDYVISYTKDISADGIMGTVSIDLPTVAVEGLSFSVDARIIANYTKDGTPIAPFALQKDFGSGKVTYLNANLLYESILYERSGLRSPYEVLVKVLEMIGVKG